MSRIYPVLLSISILSLAACDADPISLPLQRQDSGTVGTPPPHHSSPDMGSWSGADAAYGDAGVWGNPDEPEPQMGKLVENDFVDTAVEDTSTFGIDVDTGSYTLARKNLQAGQLPQQDEVRVEEFINYFDYAYAAPHQPEQAPFSLDLELAPSLFGPPQSKLLRVALKGYEVPADQRKPANLVFLIDVSGSMSAQDKLPLVQTMLKKLVHTLQPEDTLGIVTYAAAAGVRLAPTAVKNKTQILAIIEGLSAGGSTAGGQGIQKAYALAEGAMKKDGINRVVLCTDGDFNVGISGTALIDLIEQYRDKGITLSVFGFGTGNYKDGFLERLADKGNGNYAYIDNADEVQRVIGKKLVGILQVIAKDVKVQLEFDKTVVASFRLLGYENRIMPKQDFKDDTKDGGEIGAGLTVTAFYELTFHDSQPAEGNVATLRLRFKQPDGDTSSLIASVITMAQGATRFEDASSDFRFAAAVAEFAEILRRSKHSEGHRIDEVRTIAGDTTGTDPERQELLTLVDKAKGLWPTTP